MSCVVASAQEIGDRPEQQDAWAFLPPKRIAGRHEALAVVADGMGGMKNGAEAAQTTVNVFMREYQARAQNESIPKALERAMLAANSAVYLLGRQAGVEGEIAATIVAAVLDGWRLHWISVGDSRAYLLRDGELFRLTVDHVLAIELDDRAADGLISWQDALNHAGREDVTRCIGMPQNPAADCSVEPLGLAPGDIVILCSDGIYRALEEKEIAACCDGVNPQTGCSRVQEAVRSRGIPGQDNYTVIVMVPTALANRSRLGLWHVWLLVLSILDVALLYYLFAVQLRDLYQILRSAAFASGPVTAAWNRSLGGAQIL